MKHVIFHLAIQLVNNSMNLSINHAFVPMLLALTVTWAFRQLLNQALIELIIQLTMYSFIDWICIDVSFDARAYGQVNI